MSKKLNAMMRDELRETLEPVSSAIVVDYQGLSSEQTYQLRKELKAKKIQMRVVKNSLAAIAMKDLGIEGVDRLFKGPVALISNEDPVATAKAVIDFRKKHKDLEKKKLFEIKGALLERRVLGPAEAAKLATLPGKDQLRAQVIGTIIAPAQQIVSVLVAPLRDLLLVLEARAKSLEEQGQGQGQAQAQAQDQAQAQAQDQDQEQPAAS